jgi:ABC-2 type transport system ATP-binding protein
MDDAVEIQEVTKRFGSHVAVDRLSLRVPRHCIYGFIGPNGSGKTTTLRMIMRILHPDSGHIRVLGEERHGAVNDRVGYLPEERGIYKQMKVREALRFYAQLKGVRNPDPEISRWLDRMGLADWAKQRVQALSKGMAQKVQFIATVLAKPELVVLDEPFSGLDPVNGEVLREAVLELKQSGATVIFSTHDMGVAERMCDWIFMIYQGHKVLDGTLEAIQSTYGNDTVRLRLEPNGSPVILDALPGVTKVTDFGKFQELRLASGADPQAILTSLAAKARVRLFELGHPSLHDVFVRIAGAADDVEPANEGPADA